MRLFRPLALIGCFLLLALPAFSQKKFTISGYVSDTRTNEKLLNASVFDLKTTQGVLANNYGFYSITLPAGEVQLNYAYSGYKSMMRAFTLKKDTVLNISLDFFSTEEVQIVGEQTQSIQERSQMSVVDIPIQQMKKLPMLMGEVDVLKALQLMPGVGKGSEGTSGLYVRGGGPDQNLILLDGVQMYYVGHLGGFFSVFNADALSSTKLYKGGFPAQFGGRLSSVLDIRMKEGTSQPGIHGAGTIGMVTSKLSLEGPLKLTKKGKTAFIVSGRRTLMDLAMRPLSSLGIRLSSNGDATGSIAYYFYDFNAKVNHTFSDKDRLYLSCYFGRDALPIKLNQKDGLNGEARFTTNLNWGSNLVAARWNHVFSPRLFSNLTASYIRYGLSTGINFQQFDNTVSKNKPVSEIELNYGSSVQDFGLRADFDYYPSPNHSIKYGVSAISHYYRPGVSTFKIKDSGTSIDSTSGATPLYSTELDAYIEDDFKIGTRFGGNIGLHALYYAVNKKGFPNLQPRVALRYSLTDKVSLKASYAQMMQTVMLLTNTTATFPTDLWVPATARTRPQQSWQAAAGVAASLWDDKFELTVEGYYKETSNLIEYKEGLGSSFLSGGTWEDKVVRNGRGTAYGAEILLQKKVGKTTGWIGYTLSWNYRQFDSLNFGRKFFYRYDRRHDFSIVVTHELNPRWTLSAVWVYGTGNAITLATGNYSWLGNDVAASLNNNAVGQTYFFGSVQNYSTGRNGSRMPAYHRMDLSATKHIKHRIFGKEYDAEWSFSAYNAYNRQNPFALFFQADYDTNGVETNKLKQLSIFPIIPGIAYNFKF